MTNNYCDICRTNDCKHLVPHKMGDHSDDFTDTRPCDCHKTEGEINKEKKKQGDCNICGEETELYCKSCEDKEEDFRAAVRKLAQIMDMQPINDSIKATASMYVKTAQDIDRQKHMNHLEERIENIKEETIYQTMRDIDSEFIQKSHMIVSGLDGDMFQIKKQDWNDIINSILKRTRN